MDRIEALEAQVAELTRELKAVRCEMPALSGENLFFDSCIAMIIEQGIARQTMIMAATLDRIDAEISAFTKTTPTPAVHPVAVSVAIERLQSLREFCVETAAAVRSDGALPPRR